MEVVSVNEVHLAQPNERVSCFCHCSNVQFFCFLFFSFAFNVAPTLQLRTYICTHVALGRLNFSSGSPVELLALLMLFVIRWEAEIRRKIVACGNKGQTLTRKDGEK